MADEFMSRRARREAERRAAEQEFEARQSGGQSPEQSAPADAADSASGQPQSQPAPGPAVEPVRESAPDPAPAPNPAPAPHPAPAPKGTPASVPQQPVRPAAPTNPTPTPNPAPTARVAPPFDASEAVPVRHERGPLASDRPIEEGAPKLAADRRRYDDAAAPVTPARQYAPSAVHQTVQSTPSPSQPVPSPPKPEYAPPPAADDLPSFATRAERRRYLRDHGLLPDPVDAPAEGEQGSVGPTAQDVPQSDSESASASGSGTARGSGAQSGSGTSPAAMTPRPPAPQVEESSTNGNRSRLFPAAPARQASSTNLAGDLSGYGSAATAPTAGTPQAAGAPQTAGTPAAATHAAVPVESIGTQRMPAGSTPDAVVASPPAATQPAASQLAASQPAAVQPAVSQPTASQPAGSQPAATQPAGSALHRPAGTAQPAGGPSSTGQLPVEQTSGSQAIGGQSAVGSQAGSGAPVTTGAMDLTARRQRRSPVVKPPHTEGIRVVTGATQLARTQAAIDAARQADATVPPRTPTASGPAQTSAAQTSGRVTAADWDDHDLRLRASGPMTTPIDAIPPAALEAEVEGDAVENWDAPDAGEGDELASPPAPPMSARQITHEDGDILYDGEPSKLPFVVLGVAGIAALILIIFALVLIF